MGRIIASVTVENLHQEGASFRCDALVDTGAAFLVLPNAWRERLGKLDLSRKVEIELGDQSVRSGEVCGPVKIQIEGFDAFSGEVLFIDMEPAGGRYDPLLGYVPLEQSQVAVDMVGHRLVPVRRVDLKVVVLEGADFTGSTP